MAIAGTFAENFVAELCRKRAVVGGQIDKVAGAVSDNDLRVVLGVEALSFPAKNLTLSCLV